jgi:hypothetical protein
LLASDLARLPNTAAAASLHSSCACDASSVPAASTGFEGETTLPALRARLREAVGQDAFRPVALLAHVIDVCDAEAAASALLEVAGRRQLTMLSTLLEGEFTAHAHEPRLILRAQSLASRALVGHANRVASTYIQATLSGVVEDALSLPDAPPSADGAPSEVAGAPPMAGVLERCVECLTAAATASRMPPDIRRVLQTIGYLTSELGLDEVTERTVRHTIANNVRASPSRAAAPQPRAPYPRHGPARPSPRPPPAAPPLPAPLTALGACDAPLQVLHPYFTLAY